MPSEAHKSIRKDFCAFKINDLETIESIKKYYIKTGEILDPHTAIGVAASNKFVTSQNYRGELVVTLATAHPAKFPEAVIAATGKNPELPNFMKDLFSREEKMTVIEKNIDAVKQFISARI
jgi:threonine synthase